MSDEIVIDYIGGSCPCQGEGTVAGTRWYFRARHGRWCFTAGKDPIGQQMGVEQGFMRQGPDPDKGYMPPEEAERIIRECCAEFLAEETV